MTVLFTAPSDVKKTPTQAVKTQAYQSLVRPHLEYASTVWSPHTSDNIKKVEMVQRHAARYVCNRWHNTSSVSEMVSHLGWGSLAVRRSNMRLHTMYRIVHTTMGDPWHRWLTLSTRQTRGFHPWRYIPLSIIPKCATTDPRIPLNYRGIALACHSYKLCCAILNKRIIWWSDINNIIADEQNGFREGRSCVDHLSSITQIIETCKHSKQATYVSVTLINFFVLF